MTLGMLPAAASRSHFDRLAETPISVQRMTSDLVAELAGQAELLRGTTRSSACAGRRATRWISVAS